MTTSIPQSPPDPADPGDPAPSEGSITFTARSPEDLVALVPVVLGFEPEHSLVLMTFGSARPFHARVDLPGPDTPDLEKVVAQLADSLLEPARRHRLGQVIPMLYTPDADLARRAWPVVRRRADHFGLEVLTALRVTPQRWHLLVGGTSRERRDGVAYDVSAHPFRAQAVVAGHVWHGSRTALAASLDADEAAVAAVRVALGLDPAVEHPDAGQPTEALSLLAEGRWVEQLVTRHVRAGTRPDDAEVARLLRAIATPRLRDAAWGRGVGAAPARGHVAFWRDLLRRTPVRWAAPVAALLAWSAWRDGDGALAWCALDRCALADERYPFAALIASLLDGAVSPSAWPDEGLDWRQGLTA